MDLFVCLQPLFFEDKELREIDLGASAKGAALRNGETMNIPVLF